MQTATHKELNHDEIAAKAYQIWEGSGRPSGSDLEHWLQAEKELASARAANGGAGSEKTAPKPATSSGAQQSSSKPPVQASTPSKRNTKQMLTSA